MRSLSLCLALLLTAPVSGLEMLVHLPGAPTQSADAVAAAATSLGAWLDREVPELDLDVRIFRRWADASAYYRDHAESIPLVLADPAFLLDLPAAHRRLPLAVFVSEGETHRRLVVVAPTSGNARRLTDLRGATLAVPELGGPNLLAYLEARIFQGELIPQEWFSLETAEDELTATADALYGQTAAALVGEDNPLLASHLPKDLRIVYTSPPVSLPVIAAPEDWDPALLERVRGALLAFGESSEAPGALAALGIDGFRSIEALPSATPSPQHAALPVEALLLDLSGTAVPPPDRPAPDVLPFTLGVVLPRVPVSSDLAAAGSDG